MVALSRAGPDRLEREAARLLESLAPLGRHVPAAPSSAQAPGLPGPSSVGSQDLVSSARWGLQPWRCVRTEGGPSSSTPAVSAPSWAPRPFSRETLRGSSVKQLCWVVRAALTKYHRRAAGSGGLRHRGSLSHSPGGWESGSSWSAGWAPQRPLSLACRWPSVASSLLTRTPVVLDQGLSDDVLPL